MKKLLYPLASTCLLLGLAVAVNAAPANIQAQNCKLGDTCKLYDNSSDVVYFKVTPKSGNIYRCDVKTDNGDAMIWVSGGKDFSVKHGDGPYRIQGATTINLDGNFDNPADPNDEGQIKIRSISGSNGNVKCVSAS